MIFFPSEKNTTARRFLEYTSPAVSILISKKLSQNYTLPETNSEFTPENGWLEDEISFPFWGPAYFQRRTVSFREGSDFKMCIETPQKKSSQLLRIQPILTTNYTILKFCPTPSGKSHPSLHANHPGRPIPQDVGLSTTRIITFLVGKPNLNLHLPLLLSRG